MIKRIKNATLVTISQSLNAIDSGQGKSAYKLGGKVRYGLAKNLAEIQSKADIVERARQALIRQHGLQLVKGPDGESRFEGEGITAFEKDFLGVLDQEVDVDLHTIAIVELNLDDNQIPVKVLAPLIEHVLVEEMVKA